MNVKKEKEKYIHNTDGVENPAHYTEYAGLEITADSAVALQT